MSLAIFLVVGGFLIIPNPTIGHADALLSATRQDFDDCPAGQLPTGPGTVATVGTGTFSCTTNGCYVGNCLVVCCNSGAQTNGVTFTGNAQYCGDYVEFFIKGGGSGQSPALPSFHANPTTNGVNIDFSTQSWTLGGTWSVFFSFSEKDIGGVTRSANTGVVTVTNTFSTSVWYDFEFFAPCHASYNVNTGISTAQFNLNSRIAANLTGSLGGSGTLTFTGLENQAPNAVLPATVLTFLSHGPLPDYLDQLKFPKFVPTITQPSYSICATGHTCFSNSFTVSGWASTEALTGFDVDPFGNTAIMRLQATPNSDVWALSPYTVRPVGSSPIATSCNRSDAVLSYSQYPEGLFYDAFGKCTVSATAINTLSITDQNLNVPQWASDTCNSNGFCANDLQTGTNNGSNCNPSPGISTSTSRDDLPGDAQVWGKIVSVPISYKTAYTSGINHAFVGIGFTNPTSGNVGFWVAKRINNVLGGGETLSCAYEMPFSASGGSLADLCAFHYNNQTLEASHDFLVGAAYGVPAKMWGLHIDNLFVSDSATDVPKLTMTALGPTGTPANIAVGCSDTNDILLLYAQSDPATVCRLHVLPGSDYTKPTWPGGGKAPIYHSIATVGTNAYCKQGDSSVGTVNGIGPHKGFVSFDQSGRWGAFVSSRNSNSGSGDCNTSTCTYTVTVFNATDASGSVKIQFSVNGNSYATSLGYPQYIKLDRNAQNLYVATDYGVARFEVFNYTTGVPLCNRCDPGGGIVNSDTGGDAAPNGGGTTSTTTTTSCPGLSGALNAIWNSFYSSFDCATANLITGMLIIGTLLALSFLIPAGEARGWVALAAMGIGYVAAIALASFPIWPAAIVMVGYIALIFLKSRVTA